MILTTKKEISPNKLRRVAKLEGSQLYITTTSYADIDPNSGLNISVRTEIETFILHGGFLYRNEYVHDNINNKDIVRLCAYRYDYRGNDLPKNAILIDDLISAVGLTYNKDVAFHLMEAAQSIFAPKTRLTIQK